MGMRDLLQSPALRMAPRAPNAGFTRVGAKLMNQQCWCWGCDIRRPQGNLLLAFGFERLRPPAGVSGSSCYRVGLRSGRAVSLWGFGALIADQNSAIHLGRFQFDPQLCAAPRGARTCWTPADLAPRRRPLSTHDLTLAGTLCAELLVFIGDYESWVAETVGNRYRQRTVDEFKDAAYSAPEAKLLWPRLAKQVARHYRRRAASGRMIGPGSC
jgi:hypothetical protein